MKQHSQWIGFCRGGRAWFLILAFSVATVGLAHRCAGADAAAEVQKLKTEVATKGWILFSAKTEKGDYDLFLSRPDGSEKRNLTQTPDWNEFGGRFSADGKHMLYRRLPQSSVEPGKRGGAINHDLWGSTGILLFANADGSEPQPQGESGEFPWASWSPDGRQFACLYKREGKIKIFDNATKKLIKEMPRHGIFQQLFWSGDGKHLCGTANFSGADWNILSVDLESEKTVQLSRNLCCTPDFFQGNADKAIYSCRIPGVATAYGWTMLMQANADGKSRTLVYGERGRHIYYGCTSPDDQYVIFARPPNDGGVDAELALIRLGESPMIVPEDYTELKALYPEARSGPVLQLGLTGFEPHWTYAHIEGK